MMRVVEEEGRERKERRGRDIKNNIGIGTV
jgi:hypothetical protein